MIKKNKCYPDIVSRGLLTVIFLFLFRAMAMAQTLTTAWPGSGTETDPYIMPPATYGTPYSNLLFTAINGPGNYSALNFSLPSSTGLSVIPNVLFVLQGTPTATGTFTIIGTFDPQGLGPYIYYQLTIAPVPLQVTVSSATKAYGAAMPNLTFSVSGYVNGDIASTTFVGTPTVTTAATASSPVGNYAIQVSGDNLDAPNYTITYVDGTLTVNPVPLTITANDIDATYGTAATLTASYNGFVNGDNVSSLTKAPTLATNATSSPPVGSYSITASGAEDPNYTISYGLAGNLTINPAPLTITANDVRMTYGGQVPNLPSTAVSYTGFVNGDDASSGLSLGPTLTTIAMSTSPVGTYSIDVGNAKADNYSISYKSGTIYVDPAPLTVTANDASMTYGGPVPSLGVSYSGFVNGEDASSLSPAASATTTATAASAVGTYAITAGGAQDSNYTFTYVPGTLTLGPAALEVTADAETKVYSTPDPDLNYTVSGLVNGDNNSILTGALGRSPGENVGTYPITQGTLSAGANYVLNFAGNNLTITKAPQEISWGQRLLVGCDNTNQLQLGAFTNSGLPVTYTTSNAAVATLAGDVLTLVQPGSVVVTASQAGDGNFFAAADVTDSVVYQTPSLVRQHWGDVLFFDNSSDSFVQWQWYKNGNAITGATNSYYSEEPSLNGQYYVIATENAGGTIQTCPLTITGGGAIPGGIAVYPNPASGGSSVTVTCDYTAAALQGARMEIIDMSGKVWQQISNVQPSMEVTMPTAGGIYIISLELNNGQKATVNILIND